MLYTQRDSETSPLKIEELRLMMQKLALKPFEARYRIAVFRDFDTAQPRAQDALLKTLEEPAPHAILILLAKSLEPVLPTITSRSQVIHLRPAAVHTVYETLTELFNADEDRARLLAHLSAGRMGWAINALNNEEVLGQRAGAFDLLINILGMTRVERFKQSDDLSKDKAALITLLELWLSFWRDVFLLAGNSGLEPTNIDQAAALDQPQRSDERGRSGDGGQRHAQDHRSADGYERQCAPRARRAAAGLSGDLNRPHPQPLPEFSSRQDSFNASSHFLR
ncbi:MAG: hypothetical protein IPK17_21455 [Chloroflexi bacterium]|uniref:hypothetical protein n=1 Tax=Candidatus Flexifilum breve TaxID=3140694 RepID=UPI003135BD4E|nr:hypothetical protein [Chloroflexota bacterium]